MYYDNTTLINPKSTSIDVNRRQSTPDRRRSTPNRRPVASGRSWSPPKVDLRRFNPEMGRFNVEHEVDQRGSDRPQSTETSIYNQSGVDSRRTGVERRRTTSNDVNHVTLTSSDVRYI